jgi:hypothetical protein
VIEQQSYILTVLGWQGCVGDSESMRVHRECGSPSGCRGARQCVMEPSFLWHSGDSQTSLPETYMTLIGMAGDEDAPGTAWYGSLGTYHEGSCNLASRIKGAEFREVRRID